MRRGHGRGQTFGRHSSVSFLQLQLRLYHPRCDADRRRAGASGERGAAPRDVPRLVCVPSEGLLHTRPLEQAAALLAPMLGRAHHGRPGAASRVGGAAARRGPLVATLSASFLRRGACTETPRSARSPRRRHRRTWRRLLRHLARAVQGGAAARDGAARVGQAEEDARGGAPQRADRPRYSRCRLQPSRRRGQRPRLPLAHARLRVWLAGRRSRRQGGVRRGRVAHRQQRGAKDAQDARARGRRRRAHGTRRRLAASRRRAAGTHDERGRVLEGACGGEGPFRKGGGGCDGGNSCDGGGGGDGGDGCSLDECAW